MSPEATLGLLALALAAGCGAPRAPVTTAPGAAAPPRPTVDICQGSPPLPHPFSLVLRNARCDQDMYITMASVADQLGVTCAYCHAPGPDPKKEDYPAPTHDKEIAGWMSEHLMQAVKPADGSPIRCKSCHTDENGKPVAKILGDPRDPVKANEWMSLVMVKKFVAADGSKLRCKSCHVGTPGTPDFHPKVILETAQLPKHAEGGPGTPAF